jgi:hypothetical protein
MLFAPRGYKDLQEQIAKLKRMVEERDLDWIDMRSRCKRLLDRTEKAAARVDKAAKEEETLLVAPTGGDGQAASTRLLLTPRQQAIQREVLRRRGAA